MTADPSVWAKLAAPIDPTEIEWKQKTYPTERDGKFFAFYVAYIEAGTVRRRLDEFAPGQWTVELTELTPLPTGEADKVCAFKARLTVCGVTRESVGYGKDHKQADTDAFKRAGVRFGIGHELYDEIEGISVEMKSGDKKAWPKEDPADVFARRQRSGARGSSSRGATANGTSHDAPTASAPAPARPTPAQSAPAVTPGGDVPECPKCGGEMYDNRRENDERQKKGQKLRPDFKCRDAACEKKGGLIWRDDKPKKGTQADAVKPLGLPPQDDDDYGASLEKAVAEEYGDDDLPF